MHAHTHVILHISTLLTCCPEVEGCAVHGVCYRTQALKWHPDKVPAEQREEVGAFAMLGAGLAQFLAASPLQHCLPASAGSRLHAQLLVAVVRHPLS
eukprot:1161526-Pelagomonas_calceolata.AAC.1